MSKRDIQKALFMANENGYVIYPASIGKMDLSEALDAARELSVTEGDARIEDCDTEKVIARFRNGEEA